VFQLLDDSQSVRVMVKPTVVAQAFMQYVFPCMPKRRMADVVKVSQCGHQVFIQS
jgi:hypothetical protein